MHVKIVFVITVESNSSTQKFMEQLQIKYNNNNEDKDDENNKLMQIDLLSFEQLKLKR